MPKGPALGRPATYEDLKRVPDHLVAEIVDGELYATPRPALRHALAKSSLGSELISFGPDERVRAGPFDAVEIDLAQLWGEPIPEPRP